MASYLCKLFHNRRLFGINCICLLLKINLQFSWRHTFLLSFLLICNKARNILHEYIIGKWINVLTTWLMGLSCPFFFLFQESNMAFFNLSFQYFSLTFHHLFQFLVCKSILSFQFFALQRERFLKIFDLLHRFSDLVETDIQMKLLFLQIWSFLVEQLHLQIKNKEGVLSAARSKSIQIFEFSENTSKQLHTGNGKKT